MKTKGNVLKKNRRLHFVAGMALGVALSTLLYLFFPGEEKVPLSKMEIIRQAESYGMVFLREQLRENEQGKANFILEEAITPEVLAERLKEKGFISEKDSFLDYVHIQYPGHTMIPEGNFYLGEKMSFQEICQAILGQPTK